MLAGENKNGRFITTARFFIVSRHLFSRVYLEVVGRLEIGD
jgi:hypothetical protein